ncbi:uncharacterized protein IL334_003857 [Kwoniella shivajii]|uniref:Uncharacterized protein n=1 Tax=Kwoniella shivajii TaxID=564305 RepID=A0ABZ1CYR0_9TREE|nr:hypothetical protein IL334_003857 [Kwoniella shivajii]
MSETANTNPSSRISASSGPFSQAKHETKEDWYTFNNKVYTIKDGNVIAKDPKQADSVDVGAQMAVHTAAASNNQSGGLSIKIVDDYLCWAPNKRSLFTYKNQTYWAVTDPDGVHVRDSNGVVEGIDQDAQNAVHRAYASFSEGGDIIVDGDTFSVVPY